MIFTGPVQERRSILCVCFPHKAMSVHLSVYLLPGSLFLIDMRITHITLIFVHIYTECKEWKPNPLPSCGPSFFTGGGGSSPSSPSGTASWASGRLSILSLGSAFVLVTLLCVSLRNVSKCFKMFHSFIMAIPLGTSSPLSCGTCFRTLISFFVAKSMILIALDHDSDIESASSSSREYAPKTCPCVFSCCDKSVQWVGIAKDTAKDVLQTHSEVFFQYRLTSHEIPLCGKHGEARITSETKELGLHHSGLRP